MRHSLILLAATVGSLAAGCVASRPYLGDVSLRPYTNIAGSPTTFGVEQGRIVDGSIDIAMSPDGCARGQVGNASYVLCPRAPAPDPKTALIPDEIATRWMGDGGDFVTRISPDGKLLRVDGTLRNGRGVDGRLHVTLPLGEGKQWDEIRVHPVLLTIAAATVGMSGEPPGE